MGEVCSESALHPAIPDGSPEVRRAVWVGLAPLAEANYLVVMDDDNGLLALVDDDHVAGEEGIARRIRVRGNQGVEGFRQDEEGAKAFRERCEGDHYEESAGWLRNHSPQVAGDLGVAPPREGKG